MVSKEDIKKAIIESDEIEIRIRIPKDTALKEFNEKITRIIQMFDPEQVKVVPIKDLTQEEEETVKKEVEEGKFEKIELKYKRVGQGW